MNYGLPYKGSKNKLAERIVRLLPQRKHLYDLFCGGCAVSHAALLMGKYEHIHINDFNWMCPTLFMDALAGKYDNETRWISREDFQRLKDTDPYVAVVWSFGNNLRDYMYSREIEPLKRAIHYAIFFSDYEPGLELGHDLSFVDGISDVQQRYSLIRRYFARDMHSPAQSFEGGETHRRDWKPWKDSQTSGRNSTHGADCPDADNSKKKIAMQLESGDRLGRINQIATPGTTARCGTNQGGAKRLADYKQRDGLRRGGDTTGQRDILRYSIREYEEICRRRTLRLRTFLRLGLPANASRIHQFLQYAGR